MQTINSATLNCNLTSSCLHQAVHAWDYEADPVCRQLSQTQAELSKLREKASSQTSTAAELQTKAAELSTIRTDLETMKVLFFYLSQHTIFPSNGFWHVIEKDGELSIGPT